MNPDCDYCDEPVSTAEAFGFNAGAFGNMLMHKECYVQWREEQNAEHGFALRPRGFDPADPRYGIAVHGGGDALPANVGVRNLITVGDKVQVDVKINPPPDWYDIDAELQLVIFGYFK